MSTTTIVTVLNVAPTVLGTRLRHVFFVTCKALLVITLLLALIWPALYNGQPIFFADTTAYIRGADAGISRLTGHASAWAASTRLETPSPERLQNREFVLAGRSVYYGALLYFGDATGQLWPSILVQAAAVLLAISLTLRQMRLFSWQTLGVLTVGLAALTPLAFFTSFLMPDVFAGVTVLAIANLIGFGAQMTRAVWIAWVLLLSAALAFHTSHVLIATAMLGIASVAYFLRIPVSASGLMGLLLALTLAAAGEVAFTRGVQGVLGVTPVRPPFLTARLIADGPAAAFLLANCPHVGFAVCKFVDRLPLDDADTFLWSTDPARGGVFMLTDAQTRQSMAQEELRFALAVVAFDPIGQLKASTRNVFAQLRMMALTEFTYAVEGDRQFLWDRVPSPYIDVMETTKAWSGNLPTHIMSVVALVATLASIVSLIGLALLHRVTLSRNPTVAIFTVATILGTLLNAAVCGALSTPHDRYQARLIWLLPLTASLVGIFVNRMRLSPFWPARRMSLLDRTIQAAGLVWCGAHFRRRRG